MSLGDAPNIDFLPAKANASLLFISPTDGVFTNIVLDTKSYNIIEKQFDYKKGEKINKFEVGPDRLGHVIIEEDAEQNIIKKITQLQKEYKVITES